MIIDNQSNIIIQKQNLKESRIRVQGHCPGGVGEEAQKKRILNTTMNYDHWMLYMEIRQKRNQGSEKYGE